MITENGKYRLDRRRKHEGCLCVIYNDILEEPLWIRYVIARRASSLIYNDNSFVSSADSNSDKINKYMQQFVSKNSDNSSKVVSLEYVRPQNKAMYYNAIFINSLETNPNKLSFETIQTKDVQYIRGRKEEANDDVDFQTIHAKEVKHLNTNDNMSNVELINESTNGSDRNSLKESENINKGEDSKNSEFKKMPFIKREYCERSNPKKTIKYEPNKKLNCADALNYLLNEAPKFKKKKREFKKNAISGIHSNNNDDHSNEITLINSIFNNNAIVHSTSSDSKIPKTGNVKVLLPKYKPFRKTNSQDNSSNNFLRFNNTDQSDCCKSELEVKKLNAKRDYLENCKSDSSICVKLKSDKTLDNNCDQNRLTFFENSCNNNATKTPLNKFVENFHVKQTLSINNKIPNCPKGVLCSYGITKICQCKNETNVYNAFDQLVALQKEDHFLMKKSNDNIIGSLENVEIIPEIKLQHSMFGDQVKCTEKPLKEHKDNNNEIAISNSSSSEKLKFAENISNEKIVDTSKSTACSENNVHKHRGKDCMTSIPIPRSLRFRKTNKNSLQLSDIEVNLKILLEYLKNPKKLKASQKNLTAVKPLVNYFTQVLRNNNSSNSHCNETLSEIIRIMNELEPTEKESKMKNTSYTTTIIESKKSNEPQRPKEPLAGRNAVSSVKRNFQPGSVEFNTSSLPLASNRMKLSYSHSGSKGIPYTAEEDDVVLPDKQIYDNKNLNKSASMDVLFLSTQDTFQKRFQQAMEDIKTAEELKSTMNDIFESRIQHAMVIKSGEKSNIPITFKQGLSQIIKTEDKEKSKLTTQTVSQPESTQKSNREETDNTKLTTHNTLRSRFQQAMDIKTSQNNLQSELTQMTNKEVADNSKPTTHSTSRTHFQQAMDKNTSQNNVQSELTQMTNTEVVDNSKPTTHNTSRSRFQQAMDIKTSQNNLQSELTQMTNKEVADNSKPTTHSTSRTHFQQAMDKNTSQNNVQSELTQMTNTEVVDNSKQTAQNTLQLRFQKERDLKLAEKSKPTSQNILQSESKQETSVDANKSKSITQNTFHSRLQGAIDSKAANRTKSTPNIIQSESTPEKYKKRIKSTVPNNFHSRVQELKILQAADKSNSTTQNPFQSELTQERNAENAEKIKSKTQNTLQSLFQPSLDKKIAEKSKSKNIFLSESTQEKNSEDAENLKPTTQSTLQSELMQKTKTENSEKSKPNQTTSQSKLSEVNSIAARRLKLQTKDISQSEVVPEMYSQKMKSTIFNIFQKRLKQSINNSQSVNKSNSTVHNHFLPELTQKPKAETSGKLKSKSQNSLHSRLQQAVNIKASEKLKSTAKNTLQSRFQEVMDIKDAEISPQNIFHSGLTQETSTEIGRKLKSAIWDIFNSRLAQTINRENETKLKPTTQNIFHSRSAKVNDIKHSKNPLTIDKMCANVFQTSQIKSLSTMPQKIIQRNKTVSSREVKILSEYKCKQPKPPKIADSITKKMTRLKTPTEPQMDVTLRINDRHPCFDDLVKNKEILAKKSNKLLRDKVKSDSKRDNTNYRKYLKSSSDKKSVEESKTYSLLYTRHRKQPVFQCQTPRPKKKSCTPLENFKKFFEIENEFKEKTKTASTCDHNDNLKGTTPNIPPKPALLYNMKENIGNLIGLSNASGEKPCPRLPPPTKPCPDNVCKQKSLLRSLQEQQELNKNKKSGKNIKPRKFGIPSYSEFILSNNRQNKTE